MPLAVEPQQFSEQYQKIKLLSKMIKDHLEGGCKNI